MENKLIVDGHLPAENVEPKGANDKAHDRNQDNFKSNRSNKFEDVIQKELLAKQHDSFRSNKAGDVVKQAVLSQEYKNDDPMIPKKKTLENDKSITENPDLMLLSGVREADNNYAHDNYNADAAKGGLGGSEQESIGAESKKKYFVRSRKSRGGDIADSMRKMLDQAVTEDVGKKVHVHEATHPTDPALNSNVFKDSTDFQTNVNNLSFANTGNQIRNG